MNSPISIGTITKAIVFAAQNNKQSLPCEVRFAAQVQANSHIIEARLCRIRYVCKLLQIRPGCRLLDIGAGIGLNAVLATLCGVEEIHAVEYDARRFNSAELIIQFLGLSDRIRLSMHDILEANYLPGAFDAAFSFELLEHIRDTKRLYHCLASWIRENGRVYARTGANGRNLLNRRRYKREWAQIDNDNYRGIREDVIREIASDVTPTDLKILVDRTRGDLMNRIEDVVHDWKKTSNLPQEKPPCAPRNPITGEFQERLLNPYETRALIDAEGFCSLILKPNFQCMTVVNPLLRSSLRLLGEMIRLTHPASLYVAPWLEFLSVRSSRAEGSTSHPEIR